MEPFKPMMDIPYYYPCNFPLIHEVLKKQGSHSSLSLLANARLYGLPACSSAGLMKMYFNKLEYKEAIWLMKGKTELPGFEAGLACIRERINQGELFLTTGTSYYLPYCEDYLNPVYIEKLVDPHSRLYLVDHWLAVYGLSDDYLNVYDPVPSRYKGTLTRAAFHDYWKGNKNIPELAQAKRREEIHSYCTVEIEAEQKLTPVSYVESLFSVLLTQTHEFLAGREIVEGERSYYFGHAVSLRLLWQLRLESSAEPQGLAKVSAFLFDMRWSRYFFRDLLEEIAKTPSYSGFPYAYEFAEIILLWEKAHKMLVGTDLQSKGADRIRRLTDYIGKLVDQEYRFYERILADYGSVAILDKRQEPREEEERLQREALLRIVLESCQEINRSYQAAIPINMGVETPLYGRNGYLDSLGLVSLLAVVEQTIEDQLGTRLTLSDISSPALPNYPFRTVDSFVGYLADNLREAV